MTVIALEILWWGVCVGGRHYTGTIVYYPKDEAGDPKGRRSAEIRRKLSLREAKELGDHDGRMWIRKIQRDTNRFDTRRQLENAAVRWVRENVTDPDWLLQESSTYNLHRPIACAGFLQGARFKALKKYHALVAKVPNHQRTDELIELERRFWLETVTPP